MAENEGLKACLRTRLEALEKGEDLRDMQWNGKMSFGMDSRAYAHLPGWAELVKQKKKMVRSTWIGAFFLSLLITMFTEDTIGNIFDHPLKGIAGWVLNAVGITVLYTLSAFLFPFYRFRQTERAVRRVIYQDLLHQIEKEAQQTT